MTVPKLSAKESSAVSADTMRQHRGKERFLKNGILLVVLDGRHRLSRTQKNNTSGELGTECSFEALSGEFYGSS